MNLENGPPTPASSCIHIIGLKIFETSQNVWRQPTYAFAHANLAKLIFNFIIPELAGHIGVIFYHIYRLIDSVFENFH